MILDIKISVERHHGRSQRFSARNSCSAFCSRESSSSPLAVFIGYAGVSFIGYRTLVTPPTKWPSNTPTTEFTEITFNACDRDYTVYGFLLRGDPGTDAIVNVHGRFSSRHNAYQIERAELLRALGYTVLSIDLSDNGGDTVEDGRSSMGFDEQYDVLGAVDYLLTRGFAPDQIGLVGESMGAASVLSAASHEPRIRAIWADSPYSRVDAVVAEQATSSGFPSIIMPGGLAWGALLAGDRMWEVAPLEAGAAFAANDQAIHLTHCQGDTIVFYHHSVDLEAAYRASGADVTFWGLPCTQHTEGIFSNREEYLGRLRAFFGHHLANG